MAKQTKMVVTHLSVKLISGGVDLALGQYREVDQDHFVVVIQKDLLGVEVDPLLAGARIGEITIVIDPIPNRIDIDSVVLPEKERGSMIAVMVSSTLGHPRRNRLPNQALYLSRN